MPLTIPNQYGYVIASIGSMFVPSAYGAYKVREARRARRSAFARVRSNGVRTERRIVTDGRFFATRRARGGRR